MKLPIAFLNPAGWLALATLLVTGCATQRAPSPSTVDAFQAHDVNPAVQAKVEQLQPLTVNDIANALNQGVPEQAILNHVTDSDSVYQLNTADVDALRAAQAGDEFINTLLTSPARRDTYRRQHRYYHHSHYYHRKHYRPFRLGHRHYGYRYYRRGFYCY